MSRRDLAVRNWLTAHFVRVPGPLVAPEPPLILLGSRGSGKSELLDGLAYAAQYAPLAHLDLAEPDAEGQSVAGILTRAAFQFHEAKPHVPRLPLGGFATLGLALAADLDGTRRDRAVRQLLQELDAGRLTSRYRPVLDALLEAVGTAAGVPGYVLGVVPLIRGIERLGALRATDRLVRRAAEASDQERSARSADFLVRLNARFRQGPPRHREEVEELLARAFLSDLRKAYESPKRTLRCVLLLDDAHSAADAFLTRLAAARQATGCADPLLVVATSRSRPAVLRALERGAPPPGHYLTAEQSDETGDAPLLRPLPVSRQGGGRLLVAQLRPLARDEIHALAKPVAARLPPAATEGIDRPDAWLGRVLHELLRGHPRATSVVLEELEGFDEDQPLDLRLRRLFAPGEPRFIGPVLAGLQVGAENLQWLLPPTAAAVTPGQAVAAERLWQGTAGNQLRNRIELLTADDLGCEPRTIDGMTMTVLPDVIRHLQLRKLAQQRGGDEDPASWEGAHRALREAAQSRGGAEAARDVAYHRLAVDDVAGATAHLYAEFRRVAAGELSAEEWCRTLSWVQRAPHRWVPGTVERRAQQSYELLDDAVTPGIEPAQRPLARLLIAGRLTLHPETDPYADLWSDPLGDLRAELHDVIHVQLMELLGQGLTAHPRLVLHQRAMFYRLESPPW